MPHFLARHIVIPPLPFEEKGFTFVYEAICLKHTAQSLILVRHVNGTFFLRKSHREHQNDEIIKCEKHSKKSMGLIKDALKILCAKQTSLLSHNLSDNSPRQNLQSPYMKNIDFFLTFTQPCLIEIGFGSGRHLLSLTQNNPHLICIGVEIHTPSIEQILRQIQLLSLQNLYIINADARILLEILPSHIANGIFLHFPIPWNKKPHRRVLSRLFLEQSLRVLSTDGILHLRSDDDIYTKDSIALALEMPSIDICVKKNYKYAITSKYEARWKKAQKDIYDMKITQHSAQNETNIDLSAQKNIKNFSFDKILRKNVDNYTDFSYKKIARDWFLHIARIYRAGDIYVLALCLGDFHQPQNAFLQISFCDKERTHYIGENLIPTQATIKAHRHLIQILTQE